MSTITEVIKVTNSYINQFKTSGIKNEEKDIQEFVNDIDNLMEECPIWPDAPMNKLAKKTSMSMNNYMMAINELDNNLASLSKQEIKDATVNCKYELSVSVIETFQEFILELTEMKDMLLNVKKYNTRLEDAISKNEFLDVDEILNLGDTILQIEDYIKSYSFIFSIICTNLENALLESDDTKRSHYQRVINVGLNKICDEIDQAL